MHVGLRVDKIPEALRSDPSERVLNLDGPPQALHILLCEDTLDTIPAARVLRVCLQVQTQVFDAVQGFESRVDAL